MIIVNQAKDMIVNFNNVESIDIAVDLDGTGKLPHEIYYETNSKREKLGTYSTEERAKEVFNEIVQCYANTEQYKSMSNTASADFLNDLLKNAIIYAMPEK